MPAGPFAVIAIEVDLSLPSARVIRALEQVIEWRGKPDAIRCDNGSAGYMSVAASFYRSLIIFWSDQCGNCRTIKQRLASARSQQTKSS